LIKRRRIKAEIKVVRTLLPTVPVLESAGRKHLEHVEDLTALLFYPLKTTIKMKIVIGRAILIHRTQRTK